VQHDRFGGADEWFAAVERALSRTDAGPILAAMATDRGTVLATARTEAAEATAGGVSTLSHARIAELSGVPRSAVLRARLALIELGLADVVAAPGASGEVHRQLREP
jgi:hypothetical protein